MTIHDIEHGDHHLADEHKESFKITIKTLAGHKVNVQVTGSEHVGSVAAEAVADFRRKHELADDGAEYALTPSRNGPGSTLDPSSSLSEAGIHTHDELVLISRAPHVDG
jgi:hypothetical protein